MLAHDRALRAGCRCFFVFLVFLPWRLLWFQGLFCDGIISFLDIIRLGMLGRRVSGSGHKSSAISSKVSKVDVLLHV